jgi:hypothetical protein
MKAPNDRLVFIDIETTGGSKKGHSTFPISLACLEVEASIQGRGSKRVLSAVSITQWSVASKAVSQGLEFGFSVHCVGMASPLSGFSDRALPNKSIRPTLSCLL